MMTMKKFLHGLLVAVFSVVTILAPLSSASARNIFREEQLAQQQKDLAKAEDRAELLQLLEVSVDENDPILNTRQFDAVEEEYQAFKATLARMGTEFVDFFDALIELMILSQEVNHPAFDDLAVSPEELTEIIEARDTLQEEFEGFEEEFVDEVIRSMLSEIDYRTYDDDEYYFDETALWAYGYADPYSAQPGEIVWLKNDSDNPAGTPLEVTWTQIEGPDVLWLNTSHETDTLFIAPQLPEGQDYVGLTFEMMVDNGQEVDYTTVWVDIYEEGYWESFDDTFPAAVSPTDPTVMEVLDLLYLELENNDPLFNNPDFENFVNAYQDLSDIADQLLVTVADVFTGVLDIYLAASEVNHEAFETNFSLTDAERAEVRQVKEEFRQEVLSESFPIETLMFFILFSMEGFNDYEEELFVYSWHEPSFEDIAPGQTVTLFADADISLSENYTVTFTQLEGTPVTLLDTDSLWRKTFTAPTVDADGEWLLFEIMVEGEDGSFGSVQEWVFIGEALG